MRVLRFSTLFLVAIGLLLLAMVFSSAAAPVAPGMQPGAPQPHAQVVPASHHDLSPPLRDMLPLKPGDVREPENPHRPRLAGGESAGVDPVVQRAVGPLAMPAPIQNFNGQTNIDNGTLGVLPPDTTGDVGPNHYVQWVNLVFSVYNKTGVRLYGPVTGNTLWQGFAGVCAAQNNGDPIVLYDHLADRWMVSQFALPAFPSGPFYECIAVSQTGDPTGAWYRYEFQTSVTKMDDYPHFGVWPDAYYMTANLFNAGALTWAGTGVYAFDRASMLNGQPATMQFFELPPSDWGGMLPADLDGPPPPAGAPNPFVEVVDGAWDPANWPNDELHLHRFHVDWANPANTTFNMAPIQIPVAAFDGVLCNFQRNCIPQKSSTVRLDAIGDRLMYRLQYRNFGDHESLVVNHTVDVGVDLAGIRWYELRDPNGAPAIYQQGTYAPADGLHRWMGSMAMDMSGNIALGYTASGTALDTAIRYTGRLAGDPLGTLPQGEGTIIASGGAQTHSSGRWGDYSTLGVDPTDGCTFWYTAEYYASTSSATWRTRIGSFKFPSCGVTATPTPTSTHTPAASATPTRRPTRTPTPGPSPTPRPTRTPGPSATPRPTRTPTP